MVLLFYFVMLQVRVRHNVLTQYIVDVNRKLSSFQRQRVQQTPFKWMVEMDKVLDISNNLMRELLSRWASDNEAFRIKKNLVPFSILDFCFILGLPVVGLGQNGHVVCQFKIGTVLQVLVPTVFNKHQWLYALNCQMRQLHVLDSISDGIEGRYKIDKIIVNIWMFLNT